MGILLGLARQEAEVPAMQLTHMIPFDAAGLDTVQLAGRHPVRIDRSRDLKLTDFGRATLADRYLMPGESYQDLFARVASYYADDAAHAQRLYDAISRLWFMPATPILSNGGTTRGLPISCFLNEAEDSLEGIVALWNENVWLASKGGGIGSYWGNLRSIGEKVGQNGKTSGVIPFIRVMDSLTLAISQGSLRRGSAAVYLPLWHPEIEEFIEIRRPTGGDPNRKALNLHHGVLVPDAFMRAVESDDAWALISPKDGTVVRKLSARSLWIRILTARIETGEPYLVFSDHVNNARPEHQKLAGLEVKTSNLCSEITLPTGRDKYGRHRTAVCCLSSLNLDTWDEWESEGRFIEDVMRFLDNVLQDFIDRAPDTMERARYSAMRERSVGLGVMGFHSFLQKRRVPFEGVVAKVWNKRIFRHIKAACDAASREARRGARALPRRCRVRHHGTLLKQDRDRADRVDLGDRRQRLARHRADRCQRLRAEDALWKLRRAQPPSRRTARREGTGQRGHLDLDHGEQGVGAASRFPQRAREGRVPHRLRDRPALGDRACGGPHPLRLPEPEREPVPAGQRAQARPAPDPLPGLEEGRQEPLLLPVALDPARRHGERKGRDLCGHGARASESCRRPAAACREACRVRHLRGMPRLPVGRAAARAGWAGSGSRARRGMRIRRSDRWKSAT
jgi:hypothetical protein